MPVKVPFRASRCLAVCISAFLGICGTASLKAAVSGAPAEDFSAAVYSDFFCGMPIPEAPKPVTVERPVTLAGMPATINVNIVKFTYDPRNLIIDVGDTVTWTNIDGAGHTATSNSGVWNSGTLSNGQSFSFTFNSPGTFPYRCTIHPSMTGTITVRAATPTSTPTSAATPTLGNYPDASVPLSGNTTIVPDAPPTLSARINLSTSTSFKGALEGDPATGVVRVTDAHPAGTYTVTVTSVESGGASVSRTFSLTVTAPAPCSPVTFAPAVNFAAGTSPRFVSVGDFNRDGKQDMAVANESSNNVSVFLGDGSGGFGAAATLAAGTTPYAVAVGDFNGDGKQDLVVANEISNNVSILLGNGAGGFGSATNFNAGPNPTAVVAGYFNGDSYQDLAVSHLGSSSVSVLLGNAAGGFGTLTNFPIGVASYSVVTGDFNGDGKQDLATANRNASTVSVLLGNGAGSFGAAASLATGSGPASITIGDFNEDGKQDLATANQFSNDVSILLGNGTGGFSAAVNFASGSASLFVAAGDFNADGKQDLATANSFDLSILLGNGTGSFGAATNFNANNEPHSIAVGDFNGDAQQDLAVSNRGSGNVSVLLRSCAATATPTNTLTSTATATATPTFTATFTPAATNTATATPTNTPPPSISGTVTYGNAIGAPSPRFVSNVLIGGAGSPGVSATTDFPGGAYALSGFGAGSYTVTPTKTSGQNGITSFDAARVAQHVAGVFTLTGSQLIVADTSDNGTISSFDAANIGRWVVNAAPFGITGNWKFGPVERVYQSVTSDISGEDYTAFLMGEVTGNWTNSAARPTNKPGQQIVIAAPQLVIRGQDDVLIPILVQGAAASKEIIAYEFDLRYDPSVIQPHLRPLDLAETISRGFSCVTNSAEAGLLRVAVYGVLPIEEDGLLLNLRFNRVGAIESVSPVVFERVMFNEGSRQTHIINGTVTLLASRNAGEVSRR